MIRVIPMRISRPWTTVRSSSRALTEEEWGELCRSQIFPYALRCLGNRQDAEDVAVETHHAALRGRAKFRGDVEPRLWLLGIARRKIADALRRRSRHLTDSLDDDADVWLLPANAADNPEVVALRAEALSQLRQLVGGLPPLQREALLLQVVEGFSVAEVARIMNRSESAANSLLGRARDTLRKRGAKYFGGDE